MLQTEALGYSPQVMHDALGPGMDEGMVYVRDGLTDSTNRNLNVYRTGTGDS